MFKYNKDIISDAVTKLIVGVLRGAELTKKECIALIDHIKHLENYKKKNGKK